MSHVSPYSGRKDVAFYRNNAEVLLVLSICRRNKDYLYGVLLAKDDLLNGSGSLPGDI